MTDKPNTTNGENISVRCFFDGERALHGSVHEDSPSRRVNKKNIIKDGCKPMTMEEAIAHAAEILEWYGSTSEVKQRTEKAHKAASILRKRETDGMNKRQKILDTIEDLIGSFFYYDRKEDEDLPVGAIEQAVKDGEITQQEIENFFIERIRKELV